MSYVTRIAGQIRAQHTSHTRWTSKASGLAIVAAALAAPQGAYAKDAEQEVLAKSEILTAQEQDGEGIVVTGSRIARSTFTSPTPVTVIGAETIQQLGQVNIAETLQTIPQNVSSSSETNTGTVSTVQNPNIGAAIANLRGLNPQRGVRTLTLIDTRRHVPTDPGGGVDTNMIPSILVRSVETVTGGASAAYGTDALAGVVNILLDTRLTGMKAQLDYGETFRSDGSSLHAAFGAGTPFADGRGHIMGGIEYQNSGKVGDCVYVRTWCTVSPSTWQNEGFLSDNGNPQFIRGVGSAYTNYTLTGTFRGTTQTRFNPPALRNITFTSDGRRAIDFDPGEFTQSSGFGERRGGDCLVDCSVWSETQLRPAVERLSTFAHAEYELTPTITAKLEGSYGFRKADVFGVSLGPNSTTSIREDNAFLRGITYVDRNTGQTRLFSDVIAANRTGGSTQTGAGGVSQAPGVPTVPLFIAKHIRNVPGARNHVVTDVDTWRVMAGLEGDLPFLSGWNWDVYYQYGKTKSHTELQGIRINEYFTAALDAVDEGQQRTMLRDAQGRFIPGTGTPNGNIVCRGTLLGPGPNPVATPNTNTPPGFFGHYNRPDAVGCVPFNPFGDQPDPRSVAFAFRTQEQDFQYQQHVAAFNLGGDVFEGWAGPIALALGGEYRFEKGSAVHNALPFAVFSQDAFGQDYAGSLKILEGYVEANVPLLRDLPFAEMVELNGAFRHTKQTNTDALGGNSKDLSFNTWKVSGTWDVTDWLRLRATRSRDVRAASFIDLYFNLAKTEAGPPAGRALNPWHPNAAGVTFFDTADVLYPPNFGLEPEIGDTWTAGFVFTPSGALEGLRLSVDYYNIKIRDAIVVLSTQQVVDQCFLAGFGCENVTAGLDGTGGPYVPAGNPTEFQGGTGFQTVIRGGANIGGFEQSGYDVELQYRLPLDRFGEDIPGSITLRGLATITRKMDVDLGGGVVLDYLNQTGGSAFGGFTAPSKFVLTSYLTYENNGFSVTVDNRYIPQGIYDIRRDDTLPNTAVNSINDNTVDSRLYTGISTSYEFGIGGERTAEVFFSIRNLLDVDPPYAASNGTGSQGPVQGSGGPTNPVFYDTLGARWRAGLRLDF